MTFWSAGEGVSGEGADWLESADHSSHPSNHWFGHNPGLHNTTWHVCNRGATTDYSFITLIFDVPSSLTVWHHWYICFMNDVSLLENHKFAERPQTCQRNAVNFSLYLLDSVILSCLAAEVCRCGRWANVIALSELQLSQKTQESQTHQLIFVPWSHELKTRFRKWLKMRKSIRQKTVKVCYNIRPLTRCKIQTWPVQYILALWLLLWLLALNILEKF